MQPGVLGPQKQADGSLGWALPIDPDVRCIHMADVTEIGNMVTGAFADPDEAGHGQYLLLAGDFMSFTEIAEVAETFSYFQAYSFLRSDSCDEIAHANKIAGQQPAKFSTWARLNVPVGTP